MSRTFAAAFTVLTISSASAVQAQDSAETTAIADTSPEVRVDVALPSVGVLGVSNPGDAGMALATHVRVVHRSGHGVRVQALLTTSGTILGDSVSSYGVDLAYTHRFRLVGDDRFGLGLDLFAGLGAHDVSVSPGLCFGGCSVDARYGSVIEAVHMGAVAGASIDFRAYGFTTGIDLQGHALAANIFNRSTGSPFRADVALSAHLGFGFY